jgi:hypothetical protein
MMPRGPRRRAEFAPIVIDRAIVLWEGLIVDTNLPDNTLPVTIEGGALHVEFGNLANSNLAGSVVTLQPLVVRGSPASPSDRPQ